MTTLFNFRSNTKNKTGTSNKIWRITRNGRFVMRRWGRGAMWHSRPKFVGHGNGPLITELKSVSLAKEFVKRIVARKIKDGYDILKSKRP